MSDSDQKPTNRRRLFAILVLIALLILGWVVFAPGDDKKDANDNTKKTSQQDKKKDESKDNGKVAAANTDEESTDSSNPADGYVTTYTPPKVKTASTTPTVTTPPTTPVVPTPPTPVVPDPETPGEPTEPTCTPYTGQTITLKPGESSDCYTITSDSENDSCWVPILFAYAEDESTIYNLLDKDASDLPFIVIENGAPTFVEESDEIDCPHVGTQIQFHVTAPATAASTEQQEGIDYDYQLPIFEFQQDSEEPVWHDVNVNIDDTTPVETL